MPQPMITELPEGGPQFLLDTRAKGSIHGSTSSSLAWATGPCEVDVLKGSHGMRNSPIRARALDVHAIHSPAGQAELARRGLSVRDLRRAIRRHRAAKHIRIGTLIGLGHLGLLGATRRRWIPGRYHAVDEFLILLSWEQIRSLLGRAPRGVSCGARSRIPPERRSEPPPASVST